jgi:hypothetical protein
MEAAVTAVAGTSAGVMLAAACTMARVISEDITISTDTGTAISASAQ